MTMQATLATARPKVKKRPLPKPLHDGETMSLENFLEFKAEDGFKYEWNNGLLESNLYAMKTSELLVVARLQEAFRETLAGRSGGLLMAEAKVVFPSRTRGRIPDLAFFTREQLIAAHKGENPIPTFIIELVSQTDRFKYYDEKLEEYFSVGVQTVWLMDREKKRIWVFDSPKTAKICTGDDVCSAAPAIADFTITPNELFG
jgi:Uma2 family endonuclease